MLRILRSKRKQMKAKVKTPYLRPPYNCCYDCEYFNRKMDWCISWAIAARKSGKACRRFDKKNVTNVKK